MIENIKDKLGFYDKSNYKHTTYFDTKYIYLGIPYPKLDIIAKNINNNDIFIFLDENDFSCIELNIINSLLIKKIKDYDLALKYFSKQLPYIDNWATSDKLSSCFSIVRKEKDSIADIKSIINTGNTYYIRVGLVIILFNLEITTMDDVFNIILSINNHDYYVDMAIAWLLSTLATKNSHCVLEFLKNNDLNKFIINKTLSKMRDSYRISKEVKDLTYSYKK